MAHLRDLEPYRLDVGQRRLSVRVRESDTARVARIRVGPRHPLEVVVPRGTLRRHIVAFVEERRAWIDEKVARAEEIASRPPQLGLGTPGVVWLQGRAIPLRVEQKGARPVARQVGGAVVLRGAATKADGVAAIERWYRREARRLVTKAVAHEAARLKLDPGAISIRDTKTRWGSCAASGNLSFSWRLILAPPEVLEYVATHELCHLREQNHSKAFWRLLEATRPGWQGPARWLREHGGELRDYRPKPVAPVERLEAA